MDPERKEIKLVLDNKRAIQIWTAIANLDGYSTIEEYLTDAVLPNALESFGDAMITDFDERMQDLGKKGRFKIERA